MEWPEPVKPCLSKLTGPEFSDQLTSLGFFALLHTLVVTPLLPIYSCPRTVRFTGIGPGLAYHRICK